MQSISKSFGATAALQGVTLEVEAGEIHALVGENGSGKSTLMRVLAGVIQPDSGEMTLGGQAYRPRTPMDARARGVSMIHQELAQCAHLSVAENVLLGVEPSNGPILKRHEIEETVKAALAKLGREDIDVWQPVRKLPISTRQIVEIARAVAIGSKVVVFDEPTSSLTEADAEHLFAVLDMLRSQGHAVIYISHFLDEIQLLCDRMTVLRDGQMVGVRGVKEVTQEEIVEMMVGRKIESLYPRSPRTPGDVLLRLQGLTGREKPVDAKLELRRGEVVGIAGLNGAGRTELLRTVFGLDPIVSGQIQLGAYIGATSPARRWESGSGFLSEDRKEEGLALKRSLADNVILPKMRSPLVSPAAMSEETAGWIQRLGIKCQGPNQAVGELSGGNQQKVALARLLDPSIDLLLLDEPTRGIDVGSKEQIYGIIDDCANRGKAVLVVSSYLPELLGICDRIAVMHRGSLGEARPVAEVTAESLMHEAVGA